MYTHVKRHYTALSFMQLICRGLVISQAGGKSLRNRRSVLTRGKKAGAKEDADV